MWLRCGNAHEAGDLLSLTGLLPPSIPAATPAFLGPLCYTGSHLSGKSMGFQGLFAGGELCMVHGGEGEGSLSSCLAAALANRSGMLEHYTAPPAAFNASRLPAE